VKAKSWLNAATKEEKMEMLHELSREALSVRFLNHAVEEAQCKFWGLVAKEIKDQPWLCDLVPKGYNFIYIAVADASDEAVIYFMGLQEAGYMVEPLGYTFASVQTEPAVLGWMLFIQWRKHAKNYHLAKRLNEIQLTKEDWSPSAFLDHI